MKKVIISVLLVLSVVFISILINKKCIFSISNKNKITEVANAQEISANTIAENLNNKYIVLNENSVSKNITYKQLGITLNEDGTYNTDKIYQYVSTLNQGRTRTAYSHVQRKYDDFVVTHFISGNYIDTDKLTSEINDRVENNNDNSISIELSNFYVPINSNIESEQQLIDKIDKAKNWEIKYSNDQSISFNDINTFIATNDTELIVISKNDAKDSIKSILKNKLKGYERPIKEFKFTTTFGATVSLNAYKYDTTVDYDKEAEYVITKLNSFISEDGREPFIQDEMPDEVGDTYVEVSKDLQHLWYYENGELIYESDIVTGLPPKRTTPSGVFKVLEKRVNKTLRGPGYASFVRRWMRITWSGIGLHDASWRGVFGGDIYTYNGSHGCINLPSAFANELYDRIDINSIVVVY